MESSSPPDPLLGEEVNLALPAARLKTGHRWLRISCRLAILLNPVIYVYALAHTRPKGDWLANVVLLGLLLQLILPLALLVLMALGERQKPRVWILDFLLVLLGWAAEAGMGFLLITYIAGHAGC